MSTKIENALFGNHGTHGVHEFKLASNRIEITIAPWEKTNSKVTAVFEHATIRSVEEYSDEHSPLDMPWDIICFDCEEVETGRWEFVLHSACIEWSFQSDWPVIRQS